MPIEAAQPQPSYLSGQSSLQPLAVVRVQTGKLFETLPNRLVICYELVLVNIKRRGAGREHQLAEGGARPQQCQSNLRVREITNRI